MQDPGVSRESNIPFLWPVVSPSGFWTADDFSVSAIPPTELSPVWQMLLLGDGSPTRQLALLTGSPTRVQLLDAVSIGYDTDFAPVAVARVRGPRIRRRVVLENARGERLMHAVSWWAADSYQRYLTNPSLPIGTSIMAARLELFREMVDVCTGTTDPGVFNACDGASDSGVDQVWARSYLMYNGGHAFALVHEVFSPTLRSVLGPYALPASLEVPVP